MITNQIETTSVLGLWFFLIPSQLLPITIEEKKWISKLTKKKGWIYHFSRGCARHAISNMTGLDPLEIPLKAEPGKAPLLAEGWGHISISHCSDALLIGWSSKKIGIDIERQDREFKAKEVSKRFFSKIENDEIRNLSPAQIQKQVLKRWTIKEATIKSKGKKIATNLNQWIWENNASFAYHDSHKSKVNVFSQKYKDWTYSIAVDDKLILSNPILCIN